MADGSIETAIDGLQGAELMGRPLRINKAAKRFWWISQSGRGGNNGGYGGGGNNGGYGGGYGGGGNNGGYGGGYGGGEIMVATVADMAVEEIMVVMVADMAVEEIMVVMVDLILHSLIDLLGQKVGKIKFGNSENSEYESGRSRKKGVSNEGNASNEEN